MTSSEDARRETIVPATNIDLAKTLKAARDTLIAQQERGMRSFYDHPTMGNLNKMFSNLYKGNKNNANKWNDPY